MCGLMSLLHHLIAFSKRNQLLTSSYKISSYSSETAHKTIDDLLFMGMYARPKEK